MLEKYKSKPQRDITSHQLEWPSSKNSQIINAGEGVEKREPSWIVDGDANGYSHYGEQCENSLKTKNKKLGIELPYDPAIPLLGIHSKEIRTERDTCAPVFIATLFTIARTWKQPRCPSADEWIRKWWYIYRMEHYSNCKKECI